MSSSACLGPIAPRAGIRGSTASSSSPASPQNRLKASADSGVAESIQIKPRVFIAAENRLLREALGRMLARRSFQVLGLEGESPYGDDHVAELAASVEAQVLVLASRSSVQRDLEIVRKVRTSVPEVKILILGLGGEELEFLRYVRAGIQGCLLRDATAEDVLRAVKAVLAGEAVCPGKLCLALFRYFEREAGGFASAVVQRDLGLTRREQQIIPLVAQGLTNKEIADHFCLSEQTVKNHLYRVRQKIGAGDRLEIVKVCQQQGFLV